MKHGSLFSGIGGFDLAAEWMRWENIFHCEIADFPRQILQYYWPDADSLEDITKTDFRKYANKIDILTGGFPCQPFSVAGKRRGTGDNRHLWPEMLRVVTEVHPRWVVGENVHGIVNWDGGLVFEQVQSDLEGEGYEVQPYILPACSVNAPHRRDRVWFVAHSHQCAEGSSGASPGPFGQGRGNYDEPQERGGQAQQPIGCCDVPGDAPHSPDSRIEGMREGADKVCKPGTASHSHAKRLQRGQISGIVGKKREEPIEQSVRLLQPDWENFPTQSPICSGNDGISSELDVDAIYKTIGRKVTKAFNPFSWWRQESVKAYGNAIVPQLALQIFKALENLIMEEG